MTAAAVIAGLSLTEVSAAALVACCDDEQTDKGFETVYTDLKLMEKTFLEMDCHVDVISDNELHVKTTCGVLKYARNSADEAFRLYLDEISDTEGLIRNIKSFETEYGRNVQEYTYQHIKASLGENISIENEYYEDDELYLTINIDE